MSFVRAVHFSSDDDVIGSARSSARVQARIWSIFSVCLLRLMYVYKRTTAQAHDVFFLRVTCGSRKHHI